MNDKAPELLTLEKSLRRALEREEFELHYQPQVNLQTGKITGFESLIRWRHPDMGFVSPGQFIPLAEENGMILPLGEWVLRTACAQNKRWQAAGLPPVTISVNLSARQFYQPGLVDTVISVLKDVDLDPRYLELEITETTAILDLGQTKTVLQKFREMGIKLAIDDFGTGYSSLTNLQQLPLHSLKIDRSFVRDVTENSTNATIVSAVVSLARGLGLHVIVEGVEEENQLKFLRSIHCETVQGYVFFKPMPVDDATLVLAKPPIPLVLKATSAPNDVLLFPS
jgi:EAL domain-containing protein (putative c-di-GMP-specific phosphodiesterase class I)